MNIQSKIEKIKEELLDLVDKYYPKVKPKGINEGRGEAAVIVGVAMVRFTTLIEKVREKAYKKGVEDGGWTVYKLHKELTKIK